MNILVTGAAGYIGSVVTYELLNEGHNVIALDNLAKGHREAVDSRAIFVHIDLGNTEKLEQVFKKYQVDAVMHLAAESLVGESMLLPQKYFHTNTVSGIALLDAMLKYDVKKIIFSSSAATYGNPRSIPIDESHPTIPINPYGESKLIFERIMHWYGVAYGLNYISLRYFNAAGASDNCGEDHQPETHLIPNVLKAAFGQIEHIKVFGTDYPTKDGTCIRDYIHISDIARAHILALKKLGGQPHHRIYNLGNGNGYSVFQIIEAVRGVTGLNIPVVNYPRRPGDPPSLIASSSLAKLELGWEPEYSQIEDIVASAWKWSKEHPFGYGANVNR